MSDDIFRWTVRTARRWPATALTVGVAAASGAFIYAVNQGGPTPPRSGAVAAATQTSPDPCYECGQYAGNAPDPAPRASLHPGCTFLITTAPAVGSVYLSTWGGPPCAQLVQLLQKAENRQLQGAPVSVLVAPSSVDPTTVGPPSCTQAFGRVMTWRVYPTSPDGGFFAQTFCTGLKYAAGQGQKTA